LEKFVKFNQMSFPTANCLNDWNQIKNATESLLAMTPFGEQEKP